jgi:hypothetical protein
LIPLVRRDGRCLAGCVLGLVVGLFLIPAAVLGPSQTVRLCEELGRVLLAPALGAGDDGSRAVELLQVTATDNQSIQAMIHNTLHPVRATRPDEAAPAVRLLHWLLGAVLTLTTLWAYLLPPSPPALRGRGVGGEGVKWIALRLRTHTQAAPPHPQPPKAGVRGEPGERGGRGGADLVVFAGCLTLCMILVSPVSHLHYFTLMAPLVMGLMLGEDDRPFPGPALAAALVVFFMLSLLPRLPWWRLPREVGAASYGALLLWGLGVRRMWRVRFLGRAGLPEGRLRPRLQ